jgi:mRNA-degrading endonuclease RelE of RelBE toxin-antitoxin system
MKYSPSGSVLIVTICSLNKAEGGIHDYDSESAISDCLDNREKSALLRIRNEIRELIKKQNQLKWQGVSLKDLEYNHGLLQGEDFGGAEKNAGYLRAIDRYEGRFYQALGAQGRERLLISKRHFLILSALYGLVTPAEPIQLYSCPLGPSIAEKWAYNGILTNIFISYIKAAGIKRIIDLTAMAPYRNLIDWQSIYEKTGIETLHCFHHMGAGEYSLIPFGTLMRDYLIDIDEEELLTLPAEYSRHGIIFRSLNQTIEGYPTEEDGIRRADLEVPMLEGYLVEDLHYVFSGGLPTPNLKESSSPLGSKSWLFGLTSEFKRQVSSLPKNLQGRILETVIDVCKDPLELRGDTKKPLSGKLAGMWRYRLGDFRLVYRPDPKQNIVYFLVFSSRGDPNLY